MKLHRCGILFFAALLSALAVAQAPTLLLERRGDYLHVAAPQLHFLAGKAAETLQNGSTAAFLMTLTVLPENAGEPIFQLKEKFVFSFDLWEEKYSVVLSGAKERAASRLTAVMAEAWCLEKMSIPVRAIPGDQSFKVMIECSMEQNDDKRSGDNNSNLTLAGLIDVFSRKKSEQPPRWKAVAGPFHLADLK